MDTTITISSSTAANTSDFLHLTFNRGSCKDAMRSAGSSSFGRVTLDKNAPFICRSNSSYSSIPNNWDESSKNEVENEVEVMSDIKNITSPNSCSYEANKNESDSKSLILVRCDFKKPTNIQPEHTKLNPFHRTTSFINYIKEKQNVTLQNTSCLKRANSKPEAADTRDKLHSSQKNKSEISKSIPFCSRNNNQYTTNRSTASNLAMNEEKLYDNDVPMSPESRKKELCKYLKLMNPADKKEISKLQNRRSTRVRNLVQEQKQSHENLKRSEVLDSISEKSETCPTLKSFKELNIRAEKCEIVGEQSDGEKSFCFPFPPERLFKIINDFDIVMSDLVPRLKRVCRYRNLGYTKFKKHELILKKRKMTKISIIKPVLKAKEHKTNIVKKQKPKRDKCITKNNLERKNSLRSTGKLKNIPLKKLIRKKDKELIKWKTLKQKQLREQHKIRNEEKSSPVISKNHVDQSAENTIDLENFMDDLVDFDILSDEHKKCLIENRNLSTKPMGKVLPSEDGTSRSFCSLDSLSPLYGFSKAEKLSQKDKQDPHKNPTVTSSLKNNNVKLTSEQKHDKIDTAFTRNREYTPEKVNNTEETVPIIGGNTYLILNIHRPEVEVHNENPTKSVGTESTHLSTEFSLQEHDYAGSSNGNLDNESAEVDVVTVPLKNLPVGKYLEFNTKLVPRNNTYELLPYNKTIEKKSLHKSLQFSKKKNNNNIMDSSLSQDWDSDGSPRQKMRKSSHSISINRENGSVMKVFYIDYNLIVCQEYLISFWMQTPLGNVLGSQNMWIPRGQTQRIVLCNKCIQKESIERVVSTESSVIYVELWMKEHKSEMRQGPVADVFVTLYFWKQRQNGVDKRVLQLENINGFADDVQYSVMKSVPKIIVSWHCTNEDTTLKRTFVHAYLLAPDYQTVSNIYDIEPIDHYVSSLHNIEGCDNLIMGCGENKITIWNIEFGYIIATVELTEIKSPLSTLWVKCDRGFLFAVQQCVDRELRLVAINGINHSWKKLASYFPPEGFDRLKGVCVENGLLLSFYDQGILCWKAETGEPVEEVSVETDVKPCGKYVILIEENQIVVKHVLTHLMSVSVEES